MFLDIDNMNPDMTVAIDETGRRLFYGELCDLVHKIAAHVPSRSIVFAFCDNSIDSLVGYAAFLSEGVVPLLLDKNMDDSLADTLIRTYHPSYIWLPKTRKLTSCQAVWEYHDYRLLETGFEPYPIHDDLALLITTSGSTGSPKLVRQSLHNIESNAASIAQYLKIDNTERPTTTLPMNYVYGTSVINSHLLKGATILLTNKSIMQKEFWQFFREYGATSIAGVPYTYEILKKLRFFNMDIPSLRTMTQAGGKLLPDLHREFAQYANDTGRKFVVMYGAAEATARMGYLPAEKALERCGSMGIAIPGGHFTLIDENGQSISSSGVIGELIYTGDNVTHGYAECREDLQKGDEWSGRLETGDMAQRDDDGYYYIVGRKKRFLKIYGNRVGLDETERMIKSRFQDIDCACCGVDDRMYIFVTDNELCDNIRDFVAKSTGLNPLGFKIEFVENIPKNESGKTLYTGLEKYYDRY